MTKTHRQLTDPVPIVTGDQDDDASTLDSESSVAFKDGTERALAEPELERRTTANVLTTAIERQALERRSVEYWSRSLVEHSSDVILVVDAEGTILYQSPSIERVMGYRPEDRSSRNLFELGTIHPEDLPEVRQRFAEAVSAPGVTVPVRLRARHADGSWRHIEGSGTNLLEDRGVAGIVLNYQDVTERVRMERRDAALFTLGQQLSSTTTTTSAASIIANIAGDLLGWDAFALLMRSTQDELLHEVLAFDLVEDRRVQVPNNRLPLTPGPISTRVLNGEPVLLLREQPSSPTEGLQPFGDAGRPSASLMFVPIRMGQEAIGILSIQSYTPRAYTDADLATLQTLADHCGAAVERIHAEEALRVSEERFRATFDQAPVGIAHTDARTGRWLLANSRLYDLLGYPADEIGKLTYREITDPDDLIVDDEHTRRLLAGEIESFTMEKRYIRKDRSLLWVDLTVSLVRGQSGEPEYFIAIIEDITARKRSEQELIERTRAASLAAAVGAAVTEGGGLQDTLQRCAEALVLHLGGAFARIWTLNETGDQLILQASAGMYTHLDGAHGRIPVGEFKIGLIAQQRRPHLTNSVLEDPALGDSEWARREGMVAFAGYPLVVEDRLVGVMAVFAKAALPDSTLEALGSVTDKVALSIERVQSQEALRRNEERFRSLVQNSSDVIAVLAADGTTLYQSPAVEHVLGYPPDERIGKNALDPVMIHPDDVTRAHSLFAELLANPGGTVKTELRAKHADGSWRYIHVVGTNLLGDASVGGIVANYRDITERVLFEEQLRHQAFHDPLTGLPNRALFADRLEHALLRGARREGSVAVLYLDTDRFKFVNDSLGHEAGDQLLIAIGQRLQECLRPGDTAARPGGDEFTVLLEDLDGIAEAERVAERIGEALRGPFQITDHEVVITTSIGIAVSAPGCHKPAELLRAADTAMLRAKRTGKVSPSSSSRYEVYDAGMDSHALELLELETDLRRAIDRGELLLHYQPIVDLIHYDLIHHNRGAGGMVGVEALVRWEHPDRGMIPPADFIPLAEETGLILPIGRWVLREACRQASAWRECCQLDSPLDMCVNISARQLAHPDLVIEVAEILEETGLDPGSLVLEITESAVMGDAESNIGTLRKLKELGVKLAIDDFGTGYSSLSYLHRFPVDILKIDRSFVDGLGRESEDTTIVRSLIGLADSLGLLVVAEGVETDEQAEGLLALGCRLAQGYLFSRPLPAEEVVALLGCAEGQLAPARAARRASPASEAISSLSS